VNTIKPLLPGITITMVIALISTKLSQLLSPILTLEALTIGIILGMLYANTVKVHANFNPGIQVVLKQWLNYGIILLGFKLDFLLLADMGFNMLILVMLWVPILVLLARFIGMKMGLSEKLATLIGVGNSICGASAIIAIAPSIKAEDDDTLIAVGVISLLGAVGVIAYSFIATVSPMSDMQYGLWSGLTLQGVAHALAGAFARGDFSGQMGTFIKMERVLMLAPMTVMIVTFFAKKGGDTSEVSVKWWQRIPHYILPFIGAGIISSTGVLPEKLTSLLGSAGSYLILCAMIAMGLMVHVSSLRKKGGRALIMAGLYFAALSIAGYIIIYYMYADFVFTPQ
jgi:uncharacterized integral membrane protein (TIGR00698 family)